MNNPDVQRFEGEGGKIRTTVNESSGMDGRRRPARASDLSQFNIDHAGPLKRAVLDRDPPTGTILGFAIIAVVCFGAGVAAHWIVSDLRTKTGAEAPAYSCTAPG